jgi:pSer/pThr/pTyr-binding forkhead associated (FHA) protein
MSAAQQTISLIKFKVEVLKGAHAGQTFPFDSAKSAFIGRGPENEICLSNDPRISRQHAEIKQLSGQFYIVNLSHKNFVLVDGEQIDTEMLSQNSTIQIGESELKFTADFPNLSLDLNPGQKPPVANPVSPILKNNAEHRPDYKPTLKQDHQPTQRPENKLQSKPDYKPAPQQGGPSLPRAHSRSAGGASPSSRPAGMSSRTKFYGILAVVGVIGYFVFSGGKKETKPNRPFRGSPEVASNIQTSIDNTKKMDQNLARLNDPTYRRAQENYIKGFREFRQAHYARAKDYFQIVLSLNPNHDLAKRYYQLSLVKFDELVQANINQGLKYRERRNYKLCQASMTNVLIMIQNNKSHPQYAEANQYFQECSKAVEGRY